MEVLSPGSYQSKASWLIDESKRTEWTNSENKRFEEALALFDKDTPDRWQRVADMIPGKTVSDVIRQYRELEDDVCKIEAGLLPVREYTTSPCLLEWVNRHCGGGYDGYKVSYGPGVKRGADSRPLELERKKGIPWTEQEHKLFLMGLRKYGKGDWRNISRNFVVTRTPTQVASHAQKYFIRQLSGAKEKRRASIHDITTINLEAQTCTTSPEGKGSEIDLPDQQVSALDSHHQQEQYLAPGNTPAADFNDTHDGGTEFGSLYELTPYGIKMQGQQHGHIGHHLNMSFQII